MQKPLRLVAALTALVVGSGACQKDFLTEVPSDFIAPSNFYNNAGDALAAVNSVYASFIVLQSPLSTSQYLGRNLWMVLEYPTEVVTSRLSAGNERSMFGNFSPQLSSSHPYLEGIWQAAYAGINRANSVIANVPKVPMDSTRRKQIVAEAKFLRALHYYYLAGLFGGVPLKLDETATIEGTDFPRASASETWTAIEKDLTEAAAALPNAWPTTDYGRVTKGAALTLLGKAYLQHAAQVPAAAAGNNQKALDAFKQVMGLGYTLDPNYATLFDGSNERSTEIVFSFQNVRVDGLGGTMSQWFSPATSPSVYPGTGQNQFQAERPFYDSYNANDIRKAGTWLTSITYNGKTVTWAWGAAITGSTNYGSTGPVPKKYLDWATPSSTGDGPDVVLLRYADVLLSAAEAIDNTAGPTAEAYGYVNQVRARAKVPNLTPGLSQAAFKDSLFLERRYELALETHGLFDSRRNWPWAKARVEANINAAATLNKSPNTSAVEKPAVTGVISISDKFLLYPIPARACELNHALTQNAGWEEGICKPAVPATAQ